jgi:integrase/recombinase XerD
MTPIAPLIEAFFTERLMGHLNASPNTIMAYRDTFKLLLGFAKIKLKKTPTQLFLKDLSSTFVNEFLLYLEKTRKNSIRTANARLAAIHSFFKYLEFKKPQDLGQIQQVLSICYTQHYRPRFC